MTGFQVETMKSGNSIPCECMANLWSERMNSVELGQPATVSTVETVADGDSVKGPCII